MRMRIAAVLIMALAVISCSAAIAADMQSRAIILQTGERAQVDAGVLYLLGPNGKRTPASPGTYLSSRERLHVGRGGRVGSVLTLPGGGDLHAPAQPPPPEPSRWVAVANQDASLLKAVKAVLDAHPNLVYPVTVDKGVVTLGLMFTATIDSDMAVMQTRQLIQAVPGVKSIVGPKAIQVCFDGVNKATGLCAPTY